MSCATKAVLSMARNTACCPASVSSTKISSLPSFRAIPPKPMMLNLSCSRSYSFSPLSACLSSSKKSKLKLSAVVSVIAAQHEEDDTIVKGSEGEFDSEINNSAEGEVGLGEEEEYVEPPEEAKLFVGNLPYDVDSEKLALLFGQAGVVEISEVIYNRETDQSRGFGFVTMSTVEEAEKAVEIFHSYSLNGRLLAVNKAAPRGSRVERPPRAFEPAAQKIYVGNLPWDVDDGRLEQVFSEHGKVVNAHVVYDRDSGRSRGFGFVTMSNESEMKDAIAKLDGQNLEGRSIRVNAAEDKPRRTF